MASQSKSKNIFGINWFTLVLFCVLAFVCIRKDLSLNFNLNAPLNGEEVTPRLHETPPQKATVKRKKREEKLTESKPQKVTEVSKKGTSFFNLFGSGSSSKKRKDLKDELDKIDEAIKQGYLKRFAQVAVNEKNKFGIPASIILANALLHSQGGKRNLATDYNNQFAIPCGSGWNGGTGNLSGVCYRTYETAWMSFRNHSEFITSGKFAHMTKLSPTDYKSWAKGLEKENFSDSKNFSKNLVKIIEQYGLNDLD